MIGHWVHLCLEEILAHFDLKTRLCGYLGNVHLSAGLLLFLNAAKAHQQVVLALNMLFVLIKLVKRMLILIDDL